MRHCAGRLLLPGIADAVVVAGQEGVVAVVSLAGGIEAWRTRGLPLHSDMNRYGKYRKAASGKAFDELLTDGWRQHYRLPLLEAITDPDDMTVWAPDEQWNRDSG